MLRFENAPDHVICVRMSGTLTKGDIRAMESAVTNGLAIHDRIGILVDMTDLADVTGEAVIADLKFEMGLLGKLKRFPRVAIVSDKRWIAAIVRLVGPLIPKVKIRSFTPEERNQAMAFAAEVPVSR